MAYVERNPVRARMTPRAVDYEWSSASGHVLKSTPGGFLDVGAWSQRYEGEAWGRFLDQTSEDGCFDERLHEATITGRPYCDAVTMRAYEERLGRTLQPRPSGRLRKGLDVLQGQQALPFGAGE